MASKSAALSAESTVDVSVKFMGDLPAVVGCRNMQITMQEGLTIADLLASLSETYGEAFSSRVYGGPDKLQHTILVFIDGEDIKESGGMNALLGKGQVELVMLPMFGGG